MYVAVALLGLVAGQPAGVDYIPVSSRNIKLPISYKKERTSIREMRLFASRDQGATWEQVSVITPKDDAFSFHFNDEGTYWFTMVEVDLEGRKNPADLTKVAPDQKFLFDHTPPVVRFTEARRVGDEVVIQWAVDEKHPDEDATKVFFRPLPASETSSWSEVQLHPSCKTGVKFNPGTTGALEVKVIAKDLVGKKGEAIRQLPVVGGLGQTTTTLSPGPVGGTGLPAAPKPDPASSALLEASPMAPPSPTLTPVSSTGQGPIGPVGPPPAPTYTAPVSPEPPAPSYAPPTPSATPSVVGTVGSAPIATQAPAPIATGQGSIQTNPSPAPFSPAVPDTRVTIASNAAISPPSPVGVPASVAGMGSSVTSASLESARVQVINYLRFDIAYGVEQKGPSGISRVDLWATRDEGRSWVRWSQHDGRETPIRVALDLPGNRLLEGSYGFRLVPVSGAGLSDSAPVNGDMPDLRVIVDVTPPVIKLFQPYSDPNGFDSLVIPWEATDKNFGEEPISLDWSENPSGPWKSISTGTMDGVITASNVVGMTGRKLANSGRYSWRVPASMPTHKVYLKVSARDLAGNLSEVVTPSPVLVDLSKPRARIQGIVTSPQLSRP